MHDEGRIEGVADVERTLDEALDLLDRATPCPESRVLRAQVESLRRAIDHWHVARPTPALVAAMLGRVAEARDLAFTFVRHESGIELNPALRETVREIRVARLR